MATARDEISHYREFDHVVVNDVFDEALADLKALVFEGRERRSLTLDPATLLAIGR